MSNAFLRTSAGNLPPVVATSYVTDINSPAIPAANVLNVPGGDVTTSNDNGIQTDGSSGSNTLTVQLTNRILGTATTTDDVTVVPLLSFSLGATPATYLLDIQIIGYNQTSLLSSAVRDFACVRTTGAAGQLVQTQPAILIDEGAMLGTTVTSNVTSNTYFIEVTGLPASTIHWKALVTYIVVT